MKTEVKVVQAGKIQDPRPGGRREQKTMEASE
jgi:hypothetical protein